MLSDEEKKAIDYLQLCYDISTITNESLSKLGIVLNLIEKQSKEIEELKEVKWYYEISRVPKDKIKAKIEEVDIQLQKLKDGLTGRKTNFVNKNMLFAQKEVLQSLLEKE